MSRRRKLLYSLATLVLLMGGAEVVLRISFPYIRRATMPPGMIRVHVENGAMRYDPDYYWFWANRYPSHGPQETSDHIESCDSDSPCLNEYGFRRNKPMTRKKPPGIFRAMTFGDSQTHGAGVSVTDSFSAVAERALGERWEVINAAVSGFRSLNVYRYIKRHIEQYQPDVLVIDCMSYDSERDNGTIINPPDGVHGFRRFFWNSRLYYALRFIREKSRLDRPRWLDKDPNHKPDRPDNFGNHDLILEWGQERQSSDQRLPLNLTSEA